MAASPDNTLGAPTDGSLGQNVTFAFNTQAGVPQLQANDGTSIRAGVIGGASGESQTRGVGVQATANPTLDILGKVANGIIQPIIQQRKMEAYVTGMQRAMQGEAVTDIAKSEPWYSKLFGESDTVEGARAYSANTTAQTLAASMIDDMPNLRKMDGPTANAYFVKAIQGTQTGDPATDLATMQRITTAMPAVMRQQAKEHYGYKQEVATAAEDASFKSGADLMQKQGQALAGGYATQDDVDQARTAFIQQQVPAAGRDEKNWKEAQTNRYIEAAKAGKFFAVNAGAVPLAPGQPSVFDTLDSDQRTKIMAAQEAGETKMRSKYSQLWSDPMAHIMAAREKPDQGSSADDIAAQIDKMNLDYRNQTGSQRDFIDPKERSAYIAGTSVAISNMLDKQATLAAQNDAKNGNAVQKTATINKAIDEGWTNLLTSNKGYSAEDVGQVAFPRWQASDDAGKLAMVNKLYNDGAVIKPIAEQLQANVRNSLNSQNATGAAIKVFQDYDAMVGNTPQGQMTADAYYGSDLSGKLSAFAQARKNGSPEDGAYRTIFVDGKVKLPSPADVKTGVGILNSQINDWLPQFAGGMKWQPGQAQMLANHIGNQASEFGQNGDVKNGWKRALINSQSNGTEILGGYWWQNSPAQTPLKHYLETTALSGDQGVAMGDADHVFQDGVNNLVKSVGVNPDTVSVIRMDDKAGVPMFHVQAVKDGQATSSLLNANDLIKNAQEWRAEHRAQAAEGVAQSAVNYAIPGNSTEAQITHRPNLVGPDPRANAPQ